MPRNHPKNQTSFLKPQQKDNTYWEKQLWNQNATLVAGLDEAGRGAWVGPVVAAAVVFPPFHEFPEIDDSKKLTPKKREALFDVICQQALSYGVGIISSTIIDKINILQASLKAMEVALTQLSQTPDHLLIDGNIGLDVSIPQTTLIKGDSLSLSIGAASILAKVTRDRLMVDLGKHHPHFQFAKHKGYGTTVHRLAIKEHGLIPEHRRSFEPMRSIERLKN